MLDSILYQIQLDLFSIYSNFLYYGPPTNFCVFANIIGEVLYQSSLTENIFIYKYIYKFSYMFIYIFHIYIFIYLYIYKWFRSHLYSDEQFISFIHFCIGLLIQHFICSSYTRFISYVFII